MRFTILLLAASLLVCLIFLSAPATIPRGFADEIDEISVTAPLAVCFDEGTDPDYMAEWTRRLTDRIGALDYNLGGRWSNTAHGATGSQGDKVTLTYSFVPDGVNIEGDPSVLFTTLNQQFGSPEVWQGLFAQVFARWGEVTGNTYLMVSDDGASWGQNSPGVLGSRGDVRIASTQIDGGSNVLAYNFFPNRGDMVLDAAENWSNPTQNFIFLRNIVAHEHGHGLGINHVCPINTTKLLEPTYTSAFNGPQHDDILAGQRGYGDPFEPNDDHTQASALGVIVNSRTVELASLDDNSDTDWWSFSVNPGQALTITLSPDGRLYLEGEQNNDGSCEPGSSYSTFDDQDLNFSSYSGPDTTLLINVANQGIGLTEQLFRFLPPQNVTNLKLHVWGAQNNAIQLYRLSIESIHPATPYTLGCPMDIDTTIQGEPSVGAVLLVNPSAGNPLTVSSISVTGPFNVAPNGPITLAPGDEIPISVAFNGEDLGTQFGTLTIVHNGPGGDLTCEVSGTAIYSEIVFFTGQVADIGDVPIGNADSALVPIRSAGNVPLQINSVTTTAPFTVNFTGPVSLQPGPLLRLYPRIVPNQLGEFRGWMIINHSAPTSPDSVELIANGIQNLSAEDPLLLPTEYALHQNYPNPFNPTTTIAFDLPQAAPVSIKLYNLQGQLVKELLNGQAYTPGRHSIELNAASFATGVYIYRITAADFRSDRKLLLLK